MRNQGVRWRHRLRTGAGRPNTTLASSNPSIRRFSMLPPPDCFQQQVIMHERNFGFATKPHESNLRNHQEDTPEDYVAIESLAANAVGGFKILVKFTLSAGASTFRHASTATLQQCWHRSRCYADCRNRCAPYQQLRAQSSVRRAVGSASARGRHRGR